VEVQFGTHLKSCAIPPAEGVSDLASVELQDGRRFSTKLLVIYSSFIAEFIAEFYCFLYYFSYRLLYLYIFQIFKVGADGYNSRVRSAINSTYINFNYDRTAVVATLQLSEVSFRQDMKLVETSDATHHLSF